MRYDGEHKRKTRERILREAAKIIRAEGPHRLGVAAVMREAGLTHGGFYAHFDSKDDLIVAATHHMFAAGLNLWNSKVEGLDARAGLIAYIDFYLSTEHRDQPAMGCPMSALVSDLQRMSEASRKAFSEGVRELAEAMATQLVQIGCEEPDRVATSAIHQMLGALTVARCETEEWRSTLLLSESRSQLKGRLGLLEKAATPETAASPVASDQSS